MCDPDVGDGACITYGKANRCAEYTACLQETSCACTIDCTGMGMAPNACAPQCGQGQEVMDLGTCSMVQCPICSP